MTPIALMKTSTYPASNKPKLLFDTCIISAIYNKQHSSLLSFIEYIEKTYFHFINKYIYLEFIRIARNKNEKNNIETFFENEFSILENPPDLFSNCKEIYPLYSRFNLGKSQISIVDLINLTYLSLYEDLYLITFDHKDYPIQLLDRIEIGHLDLTTEIQTWAIYKFNKKKFLQEYTRFQSPISTKI